MKRLSVSALESHAGRQRVTLPPAGWSTQQVGIVHLGAGAFHRAHQAAYSQDHFRVTGDDRWAISAVTQRSRAVKDRLEPQDCLYGLLEAEPGESRLEIVGSVREVLFPDEDQARLLDRFASAGVTVVTMTVTEKGYARDAQGGLDLKAPAVAHDLRGAQPVTAIGRLVAGLRERAGRVGEGITVMSCDNVTHNGRVVKALVADFCAASGQDDLAQWVDDHVSFPSTMVDRIVPATVEADRDRASTLSGTHDEALVVAERFRQWVIEDQFAADRPLWESVGAQLVTDVEPFEIMKLRLLNATHSALAYLGALKGHRSIAEAVADPELYSFACALMEHDLIPTLRAADGQSPERYAEAVLRRFANPAIAHKTTQIAMDGSLKIPVRLLPALKENLEAGRPSTHIIQAIAGWMAYVALPQGERALDLVLEDPLSATLSRVRGARQASTVVDSLLALQEVFPSDMAGRDSVRSELVDAVARLMKRHSSTQT